MNKSRNAELQREQVSDAEELSHVAKQYDFHRHEKLSDTESSVQKERRCYS